MSRPRCPSVVRSNLRWSRSFRRATPSWLRGYYLWDATLGELHRRRGDLDRALAHTRRALGGAPTRPEKALLERRIETMSAEQALRGRGSGGG